MGSGVVREAGSLLPMYLFSMVPRSPVFIPSAFQPASIMWDTVVFPFVPVTPTTFIAREGWSWKLEATIDAAALESPVLAKGTPRFGISAETSSSRSAAAPFFTAEAA